MFPIITGVGLATPLGRTAAENWNALCGGHFIREHARVLGCELTPNRIVQIAAQAGHEAMAEAGWNHRLSDDPPALVFGTSKGPAEAWLSAAGDGGQCPPGAAHRNPYEMAGGLDPLAFGLAGATSAIARDLKIAGPRWTLSAACASGLHALIRAALLIRSGEARRVLVIAAEASVHPLFVGCFQKLGVLPPEGFGCRPFDRHRAGFLMSEAAAAVCVEGADELTLDRIGQRIHIDRFALGADATHLTGSDPDALVLRHLLAETIDGRPVDLIHAHATGTEGNDASELAAIEAVVASAANTAGAAVPHVYSHKGALGHSLGAAGLVSVVINCLAHRYGLVPPNVQTRDPLPTRHVRIDRDAVRRPVHRSISIAAGFGGAMAVVGLRSETGAITCR